MDNKFFIYICENIYICFIYMAIWGGGGVIRGGGGGG